MRERMAEIGLCLVLLSLAPPATASADESVPPSMLNRAPTQHHGSPPSLLGGAVLTVSGAVLGLAGLVGAYGGGVCVYDCEDEDGPPTAALVVAGVGGAMALLGLVVVLPLQVRARRRWLRSHGLRFSGRPGGGALAFAGRF